MFFQLTWLFLLYHIRRYLRELSLDNSIIPFINSWYQFPLHMCLNEHPTVFPLSPSQTWEAAMDTFLINTCTTAGFYSEYLWIQAFPRVVFIQATWSWLPMSINLLGIIRFKVKINFLPNILHGLKKINLISTMHFEVQAKEWKNQRSCKSNQEYYPVWKADRKRLNHLINIYNAEWWA